MGETIDAEHEPPLHAGHAIQKVCGIAAERREAGQDEEGVDGDQDGVQPVPVVENQSVLERKEYDETPQQGAVVRRSGRGQRGEFP